MDAHVLTATAHHDGAMLSRITATLGVHPIAGFSYRPAPGAELAEVRIEVLGDAWNRERVLQKICRLVGVLHAAYAD
jgi:hypothetical protein